MCDVSGFDRRTFLKTMPGAALLAGDFVCGDRAHAQGQPIKIGAPLPLSGSGRAPRSALALGDAGGPAT